jgi:signal transduction histidine kinase/ActR/RegA family two-component response regulator
MVIGFHDLFYLHISTYVAIIVFARLQNHLTRNFKITFLLGTIYILSLAGLANLGLVGHGVSGLLIFCVLSTTFLGIRGGIIAVIISAFTISIIGAAFVNGILTFDFNILVYSKSNNAWITCVVGMVILTGIVVVLISTINSQLMKLIQNLNERNKELLETNKKLENSLEEQKRLKTGLRQAQKMELVGLIAGGVVHDLNNVLSVSVNYPELILMDIPENSPLRDRLKTIKKSGLKASAIADDLLTLSRRRVARSKVLNLNHIVAGCVSSPEVERIKKYHPKVKIEINLDENLRNIEGFPLHLTKTLTNLISNAAEAMRDGGKIRIETLNVKINKDSVDQKEIDAGEYSLLRISDEGEGVSEEDKEKIFEPFYTKKEMGRSGTGLGMTIVWNTVKDHNGHIILDSMKGRGATFLLYFPMTDKALSKEKEASDLAIRAGKGESILVVDDVKEQREIAREILSRLGYRVITKASGEEALEFIEKNRADLVILDMIMNKGMDGLDTYRKIIQSRPDQKAIIASGYSETDRLKEAQKLGAGAYVKKPYLIETIAYAVREELDKKYPKRMIGRILTPAGT